MKDLLEYLYTELQCKRLSKKDALDLICQFQNRDFSNKSTALHPLLHQNTSALTEQRFSSTFTGEEFFLKDHIIKDQRVLPGVACLEMARAAVEAATNTVTPGAAAVGIGEDDWNGIRLKNIVWGRSIIVGDQPVTIHIRLFPEESGEIAYEIYSSSYSSGGYKPNDTEPIIHSQGSAVLTMVSEASALDLQLLQTQCTRSILSSNKVYQAFKAMGMEYDPAYQGIEAIYGGQSQVLVKLSLPDSISQTKDQFILHPVMMDSALASVGFMMGLSDLKPVLPVALQELEIINCSTSKMWALIRYSNVMPNGQYSLINQFPKFDIDLCDEQGTICVRMKGYAAREPRVLEGAVNSAGAETPGVLMFNAGWKEQKIVSENLTADYTQHWVVLGEFTHMNMDKNSPESIESQMNGVRCLNLQSNRKGIDKRFQIYTTQILETVQSILKDQSRGKTLIQMVVSNQGEARLCAGISGFLKTAQCENPKLIGQIIEMDPKENITGMIAKLKENACVGASHCPHDNHIRYQDGKRWVFAWSEVENSSEVVSVPWKDGGIYLITGGAGGLGRIFAGEIADQVKDSILILTGRSPLSEEKLAELKKLEKTGVKVVYRLLDATDKKGITDLIQNIQEEFGGLHGIIHSAGVIRDNFIINKTEAELCEVLAPKVSGLVNLDGASKDLPLDFFIFFSSITGSLGNPGQADYSAANAFMDAYAIYRNHLVATGQRYGRTLSINWPLWQAGGMHVDAETEKIMLQNTGMIAMRTHTGIRALYRALDSGQDQVLVMEGELPKMRECLLGTAFKVQSQPAQVAIQPVDQEQLREKIIHQLKVLFGEVTKLTVAKIDINEPLESYGIDSFMVIQLNQKLAGIFGELSKTLFYEYHTLGSLVEYLITEYPRECVKWTGLTDSRAGAVQSIQATVVNFDEEFPQLTSWKVSKKRTRNLTLIASGNETREPIAIIGMSGRYPQAKTLQEYWRNLAAGKDSITEIPKERWTLEGFYHPDLEEAMAQGKSYSKWGGFIEGFADFDPLFFNISPREALNMDPQERLFIQFCWEVLEDAGYTREQLAAQFQSRVGVFAGITKTGFNLYGPDLWKQGEQIFPNTSFSSVANRVSYLLNLQGPSMPIDTMCSSSLTAIHEACEHLLRGECEMAIAGGVNLYLHPSSYIGLCAQKMLSEDGWCKSFGEGGNGFVPGEGVGVVLLKPLSRAVVDQDHIYAIIRSTSINHGGKTNGYTVPNPNAQGELIRLALDKAGVDARTVSYIEAHGTGTELGDPIEITGLTQAFRRACSRAQDTEDTGYCAIGSVKSNIGHLEAAAGVAGLTKIILQMQHQQIVPSLHATELNPNINFFQTPFVVQQELTEWKRPVVTIGGVTKEYPRLAGISSFGAGGSNAHIVLEEYLSEELERPQIKITSHNPAEPVQTIIVLSAKNEDRLKAQVRQLLTVIGERQFSDDNLVEIAYTLQTGREAMEERLGVIVGSVKELEEKLQGFMEERDGIGDLYRGQVKQNKVAMTILATDEEMREAVEKWIQRKKYGKLLDLWVQGLAFDWNKLYSDIKPRRISLPAYPFTAESYWIPERYRTPEIDTKLSSITSSLTMAAFIHPLLHQNTSDLLGQRFSSTFTGREFFLNGQPVVPAVIYLEMARAAVEQAAGSLPEDRTGIRLNNIIWAQPIVIGDQPVRVHIGIYPEDSAFFKGNGEIFFEIYCDSQEAGMEPVINSRGKAVFSSVIEAPTLDLKYLQTKCSSNTLWSSQNNLESRGIERMYVGQGQMLVKLSLPASILDTKDQFVLHPGLMESALEASFGLLMNSGDTIPSGSKNTVKSFLPIALQEIEIFHGCVSSMWALIRYNKDNEAGDKSYVNTRVQKLDIDICDETGTVCIRMKGMEMYETTDVQIAPTAETEEAHELMTFEELWEEQALVDTGIPVISPLKIKTLVCFLSNPENQQIFAETIRAYDQQTEIIFVTQSANYLKQSPRMYNISRTDPNTYREVFQSILENTRDGEVEAIIYLWALEDSSCIQDYSCIVYLLQGMIFTKLTTKRILFGAQFENELDRCYLESWTGFERTLGIILPNIQVAVIYQAVYEQAPETAIKDWSRKLWVELQAPKTQSLLYQDGKRHVYQIRQTTLPAGNSPIKPGGTYLITGGCGGLGLLFAEHLAKYSTPIKPVNLILTGRSPLDAEKQSRIKALEDLGSRVIYVQANVGNLTRMKKGLNQAKECFGEIHGVIHAAGLLTNQIIFDKEIQSFQKVLEPKIKGTLVLDELIKDQPLDFICYFSSMTAILGDFGSCDYAIGNRFQMAYAHYRNQQQRKGLFQGKAIVIAWPIWRDGGMKFDDGESSKLYFKSSGQRFLEVEEGIAIFNQILAQNNAQHLVLVGQPSRIHRFLGLKKGQSETSSFNIPNSSRDAHNQARGRRPEMKGWSLEQCLEWDLKGHINWLLKISRDKIDKEKNLADFGFDSIGLTQLATRLINQYGINEITPTLFFRYSSLEKLIQYFLANHQATIEEFYREEVDTPALMESSTAPGIPIISVIPKRQALGIPVRASRFIMRDTSPNIFEPIAVIGMSGRFPNAGTVEELWNNLIHGTNCITEIPAERWEWRDYYGDSHQELKKTDSKWGGFIADIDRFDPLFFEISPKEAELMDPKQRVFLEEAWRCFEDAGYMGESIKGKLCGVYVGVEEGEYGLLSGDGFINSNQNATLPARIAYKLDLKGPNLALTAACSSGLVAIHQACQALRQGDCEMALAGGVNLIITPMTHIGMSQAELLSPDGKSYVFDQRANGMVPSEAVAVVLLKPLSKAVLDQDHIYGCIKASGVNYNGKGNGITAPNPESQAELIKDIYDKYHIDPRNIQYIIPQSLGSKLGDPIEIEALTNAFRKYTDKKQYCAIGSIKPLIGHTFAASGVVSLISLLMAMRNQTILALHNYQSSNEYINFIESPFIPNQENQKWTSDNNQPRLGAISTTGTSGTNAHAVIEEYIPIQEDSDPIHSNALTQVIVFSAKDPDRLRAVVQQMLEFSERNSEFSLSDFAYTLQVGREAMASRLAMVIKNREELIHGLKIYLNYTGEENKADTLIPFYSGDLENNRLDMGNLLSGKIEETIVELLLKEKNLEKIADYWVKGGVIPWQSLHEGEQVRRISLPTYPFVRERYWCSTNNVEKQPLNLRQPSQEKIQEFTINSNRLTQKNIQDHISEFLSFELNLTGDKIRPHKNIGDYGVNSIIIMKLMRNLENRFQIKTTGREMLEFRTIESLAVHITKKIEALNNQEGIQNKNVPFEIRSPKLSENENDREIEILEKFKKGILTFEEVQDLI